MKSLDLETRGLSITYAYENTLMSKKFRALFCLFTGLFVGEFIVHLTRSKLPTQLSCGPSRFIFEDPVIHLPSPLEENLVHIEMDDKRSMEINTSLAVGLQKRIRIVCYLLTIPETHKTKALHVKLTWARRCSEHYFMSSAEDPLIESINLHMKFPETRLHLWTKLKLMLRYVYKSSDHTDFYYKADDDTFAVVENLRHTLSYYNPEEPLMFGFPWFHILLNGHMGGGPGYIFTRAALLKIVEQGLDKLPTCPRYEHEYEDLLITVCARSLGVKYETMVDHLTTLSGDRNNQWLLQHYNFIHLFGRQEKLPFLETSAKGPFIHYNRSYLSSALISAHYMKPTLMYLTEFLAYHLRPIGIAHVWD